MFVRSNIHLYWRRTDKPYARNTVVYLMLYFPTISQHFHIKFWATPMMRLNQLLLEERLTEHDLNIQILVSLLKRVQQYFGY